MKKAERKKSIKKQVITCAVLAASLLLPISTSAASAPYTLYQVGSTADKATSTSFGQVYMGGSIDVDEAFKWMIQKANGGDFLVIRATGTDAYNSYIYDLAKSIGKPLNSVSTIVVDDLIRAGSDSSLMTKLTRQKASFLLEAIKLIT
ncbi:hypothetical protein ACTHPB_23835 [Priestia megaterium]|uniref:hypothetical protein n=1 Tax=Priestia megaterium TaxID=1404 RepID=UPI003F7E2FD1